MTAAVIAVETGSGMSTDGQAHDEPREEDDREESDHHVRRSRASR